jgi:hypothetical protein
MSNSKFLTHSYKCQKKGDFTVKTYLRKTTLEEGLFILGPGVSPWLALLFLGGGETEHHGKRVW